MEVLDKFDESAELFIKQQNGNAKKSLQIALAYISGHYKQQLPTKSLLTGKDRMTTLQMSVESGKTLDQEAAKMLIEKYWAPKLADSIRYMKSFADGTGVVFDLRSFDADTFIEVYLHLKETQDARRVDFEVKKCTSLPSLAGGGNGGGSSYSRGGSGNNGGGYNGGDRSYGGGRGSQRRYNDGGNGGSWGGSKDQDRSNNRGGGGGGDWGNRWDTEPKVDLIKDSPKPF